MMNNQHISSMLAITSLAFSTTLMAQGMSNREYNVADKAIEAEYKSAMASCDSFADNARNICMTVAKGHKKVAKAQLEARYKPSKEADYNVSIARATADYSIAYEKCEDKADNVKDICQKEAKAARVRADSDAESQLMTSEAIATNNAKTIDAHMKATEISEDARRNAAASKRQANDTAEKCKAFTDEVKCLSEVEIR
jgi:hypothetical protein